MPCSPTFIFLSNAFSFFICIKLSSSTSPHTLTYSSYPHIFLLQHLTPTLLTHFSTQPLLRRFLSPTLLAHFLTLTLLTLSFFNFPHTISYFFPLTAKATSLDSERRSATLPTRPPSIFPLSQLGPTVR